MVVPVSFCISCITFPPGPMTAPMNAPSISILIILGECSFTESAGLSIVFVISSRIDNLPSFACFNAFSRISYESPLILISI